MLKYFFSAVLVCLLAVPVMAAGQDSDNDGVQDMDEINIYHTDPAKADTDQDGYNDWLELNSSYSPLASSKVKLEQSDYDKDGLSDRMELNFHTDLSKLDTDGDGYADGTEVAAGYDPLNKEKAKLNKKIEVNLRAQKLTYFLGGVKLGEFPVSSGLNNSTPKGNYKILNKNSKAWSSYGLWMPYWLGLGRFGIHELPIWPGGRREGEDHLGKPASHGCIRLGIGSAKKIYDWAEVGIEVKIN